MLIGRFPHLLQVEVLVFPQLLYTAIKCVVVGCELQEDVTAPEEPVDIPGDVLAGYLSDSIRDSRGILVLRLQGFEVLSEGGTGAETVMLPSPPMQRCSSEPSIRITTPRGLNHQRRVLLLLHSP